MIPSISCVELEMRLWDDDVVVVVVGRAHRRIPGSLQMTPEEIERDRHVLPDDELVVLCGLEPDGGGAEAVWERLARSHPRTVCLDGGLARWLAEGFPTQGEAGDLAAETRY